MIYGTVLDTAFIGIGALATAIAATPVVAGILRTRRLRQDAAEREERKRRKDWDEWRQNTDWFIWGRTESRQLPGFAGLKERMELQERTTGVKPASVPRGRPPISPEESA